jgi:GTP-binding protein HflX
MVTNALSLFTPECAGRRQGGPSSPYPARSFRTRQDLFGNTAGLKASQTKKLLATYRRRVRQEELCSGELARHLAEVSRETGRQVGVLLNRRGEVENVVVGDARQLVLPDIGRARAGQLRLRGLRLVHTHLKDEPLTRDDLTDLILLRLDAVAAIVAREGGLPGRVYLGTLLPLDGKRAVDELYRQEEFASIQDADFDLVERFNALEQEMSRAAPTRAVGSEGRAILVGVHLGGRRDGAEASMAELRELARTASVEVVDVILQGRREIDPRTLVGEGKLQDILVRSMALSADLLVFDHNLSPSQARHIGELTALKILDRTQLILDIFARRAQSADGKLQVELAQLKYRLPRLAGSGEALSRLAGGIGGRGPGETKLEIDRRRVRDRITHLEGRVDRLSTDRQTRRRQRTRQNVPIISIVGYTNAGKSTLLNALTHSDVLAEDKLFATLDPTSRRLRFPRDREVVLTDTVGFIRDLPKDLVAAFRATLEELEDADLLLHVVDASDPRHEQQAESVERILGTLDLAETPRLLVFNKADRAPEEAAQLAHRKGGVAISALARLGFVELLARCEQVLFREGKVQAPFDPADPEFRPPRAP